MLEIDDSELSDDSDNELSEESLMLESDELLELESLLIESLLRELSLDSELVELMVVLDSDESDDSDE